MNEILTAIGAVLLILGLGTVFLLPTIIAFKRNHQDRIAILLINVLLLPLLLGWLPALLWALFWRQSNPNTPRDVVLQGGSQGPEMNRFCTKCGAAMKTDAVFCSQCGAKRG